MAVYTQDTEHNVPNNNNNKKRKGKIMSAVKNAGRSMTVNKSDGKSGAVDRSDDGVQDSLPPFRIFRDEPLPPIRRVHKANKQLFAQFDQLEPGGATDYIPTKTLAANALNYLKKLGWHVEGRSFRPEEVPPQSKIQGLDFSQGAKRFYIPKDQPEPGSPKVSKASKEVKSK